MKNYERRAAGKETYYKLAVWDDLAMCWRDGKRQYESEDEARKDAKAAGRYRISVVGPKGRQDNVPFTA